MSELLLLVAGLIAGVLNTLAGGGSFVVFPALLAVGVPPVIANASNTYAALPGYASGALGFWKDLRKYKERLLPYSVVALIFGYLGAELLLHVSNATFSKIVPWLMLFATLLFAYGGAINRFVVRKSAGMRGAKLTGTILILLLLAALSVYGGFFNAGFGILLLAFVAVAGMSDIHAMNGMKLWISTVVAIVAVIRFAVSGSIDWYHGSIALVGVTVGAYAAARLAHRVPTQYIRLLVIVYSAGLTAWFFWKEYAG
ncbi:sulfite exporter TauE/SafE family protein [Devosia sp.]|uniref:sulfite exporter TauE/SafE family protein n=1 Tax=Devosia sp. TaxID=1871048 RepID=UPI003BAAB62A